MKISLDSGPALALALAWLAVGSAACRDPKLGRLGCQKDGDCGNPAVAYRCDSTNGTCYCRTNQACPPSQFCNPVGFCQDRAGCEKNADCLDANLFCDTTTGTCLAKGRCSIDLQCPLGQVCDTARSTCVEGCRSNGDCAGSSCRCGGTACACTGKTQAEVQSCPIGVCDPYFCADPSFCKFGELCGSQPDAGTPLNQCYSDYDPNRRPYCDNCTFGGGISVCGNGPNYCLVDTAHPGNSYCGVDCSAGQSCPRGYACHDVIVVFSQWTCSAAAPGCHANPALPCVMDSECPRGGHCAKSPGMPNGFCAGSCSIAEGHPQGFCSCEVDDDCAQETCGSNGECGISRRPCIPGSACPRVHCVDFNGSGGCLIGQNCAPANGLTCLEVQ